MRKIIHFKFRIVIVLRENRGKYTDFSRPVIFMLIFISELKRNAILQNF